MKIHPCPVILVVIFGLKYSEFWTAPRGRSDNSEIRASRLPVVAVGKCCAK
uniref:Uncharacterized protein n=1 Tax=Anguilla anguilla TaxID=7936 RepID=A0A0E9UVA0_ANGAN